MTRDPIVKEIARQILLKLVIPIETAIDHLVDRVSSAIRLATLKEVADKFASIDAGESPEAGRVQLRKIHLSSLYGKLVSTDQKMEEPATSKVAKPVKPVKPSGPNGALILQGRYMGMLRSVSKQAARRAKKIRQAGGIGKALSFLKKERSRGRKS